MHCEVCHHPIAHRFAPANDGIFHDDNIKRGYAAWWMHTCYECTVKAVRKYYENIYGHERSETTGRLLYVEQANTIRIINVTKLTKVA